MRTAELAGDCPQQRFPQVCHYRYLSHSPPHSRMSLVEPVNPFCGGEFDFVDAAQWRWGLINSTPRTSELDALGQRTVDDDVGAGDEAGAGLATKATALAISCGVPIRPVGLRPAPWRTARGSPLDLRPDAAGEVGVAGRHGVGPDPLAGRW